MKVLVIDNDKTSAEALSHTLAEQGQIVHIATDGASGLRIAKTFPYDLILLDVQLPVMDGFTVLRELRKESNVPVLIVSARDELQARVQGLSEGADDYLAKPYATCELVARMKAISRRSSPIDDAGAQHVLRVGDLELQLLSRKALREGQRIRLTAIEFALLERLMRKHGEVQSRMNLAAHVWGINFDRGTNAIDVAVRRLRMKMDDPFSTRLLHTVWGLGYVMEQREPSN
ncbi:response regulator transcription factor [Achromobacter sp. MY14]|uniref:response regulator n=1 Tax=Achromobacter TaxID=222 RepID=UPI000F8F872F|nr:MULTISPECIES: response regulator transcription factor [Achromobacter]AZS79336.1 response regulator transcription factor [Achromobacter spanius]MCD0497588.1 response regulator transcription factor [Achromobacter sp. MY14]